jgi:murein DD-endopeptidase MepM/ murein hydrolase activator NlpD
VSISPRSAPAQGTLALFFALNAAASFAQTAVVEAGAGHSRPLMIAANSIAVADNTIAESDDSASLLAARRLIIPVAGISRASLRDTFTERRGTRPHAAIDIIAPRGTPVIAVGDGRIVKLFESVPGGHTIYEFDPEEKFAYYYAHLDAYAEGLKEGMAVKRGDLLGYVGNTGNAAAGVFHLHFALFRLGPARHWWEGTAVNPYALLNDPER